MSFLILCLQAAISFAIGHGMIHLLVLAFPRPGDESLPALRRTSLRRDGSYDMVPFMLKFVGASWIIWLFIMAGTGASGLNALVLFAVLGMQFRMIQLKCQRRQRIFHRQWDEDRLDG